MTDPRRPPWRRYFRFLGPDVRADVDDELAFHLAMRIRDLEARGLAPSVAREEALRQFGDLGAIRGTVLAIDRRRYRKQSRRERVATMLTDVRLAARSLARTPGFTTVALLCVALGVASAASIFSAVNGILIRPLPYPDAHELAAVYTALPDRNWRGANLSYWDWVEWRDQNTTFEQLGLWTWNTATLSGTDADAERVDGAEVTANLFPLLGVPPVLGRGFVPEDEQLANGPVVLLSYGLWQRRFGGDSAIVGATIRVNARPFTVVGVMPPRFGFPERGQLWMPLQPDPEPQDRDNRYFAGAIGRLRSGVTPATAQRDLDAVMRRLEREYPDSYEGWTSDVRSLRDDLVGELRLPLLVFLGAVGMVLLIVCANVANLMLARGAARQRDVGIRVALGAGRRRIVRLVLLESLLIAGAGGVLGALLVPWGLRLLARVYPSDLPYYLDLGVDAVVVGFVAVTTIVAGLIVGAAPALRATRVDVNEFLKEGARGDSGGRRTRCLRDGLVVAQLALSLVLLAGASLLLRSYQTLTGTQLGFDEQGILSARISLPSNRYRDWEARRVFYETLYERLGALPGVEVVGSASGIPFSGWNVQSIVTIEGRPPRGRDNDLIIHNQFVSPSYFEAIGVPLLRGRGLTAADRDSSVRVGVINEALARQEFAGEDPIGKRLKFGDPDSPWPWMTIVGVVGDFHHWTLPQPVRPAIYFSHLARPQTNHTLVLRTSFDDPFAVEAGLRRVLRELDPDVPPYQVQSFEQAVSRSLWRQRMPGRVLLVFAAMAMVLAAIGLYGVISYTVAQRTRELGVRIALGASRGRVAMLVLRQGARLVAFGVVIGLAGAFVLTRAVEQLLYGIAPTDPVTFVGVPMVLAAVALVASLLPARKATRVDPVVAMRAD